MSRNIGYFIVFNFILMLSCSNKTEKGSIQSNKPESFEKFMQLFNTNESFRNSRIETPLPGFNSDDFEDDYDNESEVLEDYYWNDQEIKLYLKEDYSPEKYNISIVNKNDTIVEDRIFIDGSGFEIKRKFKLKNNNWYLSYYFYRT